MDVERSSRSTGKDKELTIDDKGEVITYLVIEDPRAWVEAHPVEIARAQLYKPKEGGNTIRAYEIARNVAVGTDKRRKLYRERVFITNDAYVYSKEDMAEKYQTVDNNEEHGVG